MFKLWLMWKSKGDLGMERDIDHLFMVSRSVQQLQVRSLHGAVVMSLAL